ncbi:Catechol 1,2-dioxygenase 1 [Cytospora mali]|uniref:Catechol 1,2-dioxygenase 1 n=1 Tax=Cytospora mali TaxID=578113 RepID=A0A194UVS0_CYTMA|nr:Catechol 1,2-dioxygenase 1 [Valsa mali var. pyri (nom. inval.)]
MRFSAILVSALAVALASAHGNHDIQREQAIRRTLLEHTKKDLSHCANKIRSSGLEARNIQRRAGHASALMEQRGLRKNLVTREAVDNTHLSDANYTLATPEETIFSSNNSCVLSPEVTEGPYYVAGEYIRSNVTEGQAGVALHLEVQVLDINTCEPVTNVYTEIWHCNSTGVYSGVSASNNGDSATETSNLNATFLRGLQETDSDGVVIFDTLVPGHYTGRTNHIHVLVHTNATAQANGTVLDTTASHVGQMFFDQDLITEVEATSIYLENEQPLTTNDEDSILQQEAASSDPYLEYVLLGDTVEDGLLGWLAFGIDPSLSDSVSAAATLYASGGVSSSSSGGGGPGGGGGTGPFGGGGGPFA